MQFFQGIICVEYSFLGSFIDIDEAIEEDKIGSLISIEGGHSIQSSLAILRQYYDLGVRMMTLAKGCSTPW